MPRPLLPHHDVLDNLLDDDDFATNTRPWAFANPGGKTLEAGGNGEEEHSDLAQALQVRWCRVVSPLLHTTWALSRKGALVSTASPPWVSCLHPHTQKRSSASQSFPPTPDQRLRHSTPPFLKCTRLLPPSCPATVVLVEQNLTLRRRGENLY